MVAASWGLCMYNGYAITIPCRSPVYPCAPGPAESSSPPSPSVAAPRTVPAPAWPSFKARRAGLPLLELFLLPSPTTLPPHLLLLLPIIISSHTTPKRGRGEREEGEGGSADLFLAAPKFSSEAGRTNEKSGSCFFCTFSVHLQLPFSFLFHCLFGSLYILLSARVKTDMLLLSVPSSQPL